MFCTNCGAKLSDDAKFCLNCGAKIDAPAPAVEPVPAPTPVAPVAPIAEPAPVAEPTPAAETVILNDSFAISEPAAPAPTPAPKKNKTPAWVIVIIIILALALVSIGGYIVYDEFFADSVSTSADDDDDDKKASSGITSSDITSSGDISSDDTSSDNSSSIASEDEPSSEQPTSSNSTSSKIPAQPKINSNYTKLYTDNGVSEDATPSAITRCDTYQVYGHEVMDGVVEKMEAGYNDGVLTSMRNVVYYTHSALAAQWGGNHMVTEDNINTLIANWKTQFDSVDNLDFATVSYVKEAKLVKIVVDYTDLDNSSNCEKVFGQAGTQSMTQHKSLMEQYGYIEKYVD